MSTLTLAMRDSSTMTRRQLKRLLRYPSMTVQLVATPVIILLLFLPGGLSEGPPTRAALSAKTCTMPPQPPRVRGEA